MGKARFVLVAAAMLFARLASAEGCGLGALGTLPVDMVGYQATTMVKINGTPTRLVIDTGAFFSIMSAANASALGLKLEAAPFGYRVRGIGGSVEIHQAHVKEFGILDTTLKNVDFIVGGTDAGSGLLGANLLDFMDLEIDLAHGKMTLFQTKHCEKASLAYWVKDGNYNMADIEPSDSRADRRTFFTVTINGKKVRALLDSGASATVLSREAAERVGINLKGPEVKAGYGTIGVGSKPMRTWIANIDSFSVGSETIQHSQMQVLDGDIGGRTDLLLGVDFILAHHMFIANSQKKAYFTYNGGRVFTFAEAPDSSEPAADGAAKESGAVSTSAADYAMQGQAQLSRGESAAAVADLDKAIELAPGQAEYYVSRARAHEANKQGDAALADLDKALGLDAKNVDALLMRAELRFERKDSEGASADLAAATAVAPAGSTRARAVAALYVRLDQPAAALPLLDDWIRLHGNDAMLGYVLNERCQARALANQMLEDALKDCRKAIRRDGENPAYFDSLGLVELRLGQYGESIKAYEQAVAKNPRSAWSRYGLGLAKIHNGDANAGDADLVAARALDPKIEARAVKYGLATAKP